MKTLELIIGFLHSLLLPFVLLYPILIKKSKFYDKIYLATILLFTLSWITLKGECLITLLVKYAKNKSYKMGDDVFDISDIKSIFPFFTRNFVKNMYFFSLLIIIFLFSYAAKRGNSLSNLQIMLFCIIYLFTILEVRKFYNESINNIYEYYKLGYILIPSFAFILLYLLQSLFSKK